MKPTTLVGLSSLFHTPEFLDDGTCTQVPNEDWHQRIARRKARFAYQGIDFHPLCATYFWDVADPAIDPISSRELDPQDPSQDMCFTDLARLISTVTPLFASFNGRDPAPSDMAWWAGCDCAGTCWNGVTLRAAGVETILEDHLPVWAAVAPAALVADHDQHIFLLDNCAHDGCWATEVDVHEIGSATIVQESKASVFESFWDQTAGLVKKYIYW